GPSSSTRPSCSSTSRPPLSTRALPAPSKGSSGDGSTRSPPNVPSSGSPTTGSRPAASRAGRSPCRVGNSTREDEMRQGYFDLSYYQVAFAALLILINGSVSALLGLGLGRRLLLAAACTVVQLLLVGLVLEWVFHAGRWYVVLGLMLAMTVV